MSRSWALFFGTMLLLVLIGISIFVGKVNFPGETPKGDWVWYHIFAMFTSMFFMVVWVIVMLYDLISEGYDGGLLVLLYEDFEEKESTNSISCKSWNIKKIFWWGIFIVSLLYILNGLSNIFGDTVNLYNTSKKYQNKYTQKVDEKKGFYDKLWKTYLQKDKITNVNKETFIEVTKIIMENRRDGKDVTWKWIQENQNIPYEEFTKFYTDLSNFITEQREGYFNIEKECQLIANQNNTLLDTFPNNLYNKILNCQRIKFEYGFTSDSTEVVFKSKKENIK